MLQIYSSLSQMGIDISGSIKKEKEIKLRVKIDFKKGNKKEFQPFLLCDILLCRKM